MLGIISCGVFESPPKSVVRDALLLQLQITDNSISTSMNFKPTDPPEIKRIRVEERYELPTENSQEPIFRLTGHVALKSPGKPLTRNSFFELFLEQGSKGQSWRLARPIGSVNDGSQAWITYPFPLRSPSY